MKRNIYVASSWRNIYQQGIVQMLRELGHDVYDFRNPAPDNNGFAWSDMDRRWQAWEPSEYRKALQHPIAKAGFLLDYGAMLAADTCVLVLPCGRSAHIEAGYFNGAGKDLFIYMPEPQDPELMYLMAQALCLDHIDLIQAVEHQSGWKQRLPADL